MPRKRQRDIRTAFGTVVRARRQELGLSQEEFAVRAELNRSYIGDLERGTRNVALQNVQKLATALGLSLPELFRRVEENR